LWQQALHSEKLSAKERRILSEASGEEHVRQIASSIGDTVAEIEKQNQGKEWKLPFCEDVIVMNDVAMKILRWVHKFDEIGDIIVQYDPGHAALPWAAFRFLLKVNMSSQPYEQIQKTDDNLQRSAWTSHTYRTPS
jgi:predicted nicotinamide N-methyase